MSESRKMKHIDEIIVVEGRDDTSAILAAVDAVTIETHGYGIRRETLEVLDKAYSTKGIIIFTDPDPAGERIRRRLSERFPNAKHAFLERDDARSGSDIGVENADPEAIITALDRARAPLDGEDKADAGSGVAIQGNSCESHDLPTVSVSDMDRWGLAGGPGSSYMRRALGRELGIGFAGAKTFLKRLNHFGISPQEIEEALKRIR